MINDDQFKRLFEKNLREYLPQLRREILNLDDYVSRADYDNLYDSSRRRENSLLAERDALKQKLSAAEENLRGFKKECDYYRDAYADLDAAYKNYLALDEKIRYQLAGIFGDAQTVQGFLIGAANEKHINDFWDYLRYSLNEKRLCADDAKILTGLFDFCFDALNHSSREPIYLRLKTELGSRFNSATMMRTSDSRQLGRVQSVLLEGFADRVGNVIRTSLVFIAD